MKICGIYSIKNKIDGKIYIGSALDINKRWIRHRSDLNLNRHQNRYLQRAWINYWSCNFDFTILEETSKENLIEREQFWLDYYQAAYNEKGYNLRPNAANSLGVKHSVETRKRMSEAKQKMTEETKRKIGLHNKGKRHSEEHKRKISLTQKGRPKHSEEVRKRISDSHKGKIISEEQRKRMSEYMTGRKRGKYKKNFTLTSAPIIIRMT